jgi:two-component system, chemotaxis family, CheB/CheR fusion protein
MSSDEKNLSKNTNETVEEQKANPTTEESTETAISSEENFGNLNFSVVAVGASAGGLEALEHLFTNMPTDTGLAFVVIQHLSPDYKSLMVELLSKYTRMNVIRVEDGMKVEPNCVYLIPPKKNMTLFHGKLYLTEQNMGHGLNLPIDIFFRSMAEDLGERSIGVVLSGTGSDGTLGIRAIKGAGGMVMVQDENTAKFDGMPRSAISTGLVDYILPPEDMGNQLVKYTKHPFVSKAEQQDKKIANEDSFSKILALIRTRTGIDFTFYKPNTIVRRIERRISVNQVEDTDEYLNLLMQIPSEIDILYKELLIGVTKFFRDSDVFDAIENKILPKLMSRKKQNDSIRIWVVGCSTGEEAYSIAMLFQEYMLKVGKNYDVKIFATDLDREAIEYASLGIYPESIAADITEDRLKGFFKRNGDSFKVTDKLRQMVIFATHNIIKDPPFSKMDMISCRNMLIYLQPVMQKKVLSAFSFSINQSGYLVLGTSESVGEMSSYFTSYDNKNKIYFNNELKKPPVIDEFYTPPIRSERLRQQTTYPQALPRKDRDEDIFGDAKNDLFVDYVPPTIIVNDNLELIHSFGEINEYIKLPSGKVNLNVLHMVNSDLSIAMSTAIHKSNKENARIVYREVIIRDKDKSKCINLVVKPFQRDTKGQNYNIIVFEECPLKHDDDNINEKYDASSKVNQRMEDLEQELKYTKENLQATIEELETSNEELQATNEELIASNEELQSTNEELQSVNEELYTVNSEYQNKIEELTELYNDMNNWFKITNIGTIFLDLKLRVRKFTPGVSRFVNLLESDIGRPIKHISYNFDYKKFLDNIDDVVKDLQPIEKELQTSKGDLWFLLKIQPYRTLENAVKGIVVTFIDITTLKQFEQKIDRDRSLLLRVLESSPIAKTLVDRNGDIVYANKKAEELLGISREEIQKRRFNSPEFRSLNSSKEIMKDEEKPFQIVLNTKESVYNIIEYIEKPDGTKVKLIINGAPSFDENGEVDGAVFAFSEEKD